LQPLIFPPPFRELLHELFDHVARDFDRKARVPVGRLLDRREDAADGAAFDEIAHDAGLQHLEHRRSVVRSRERKHLRRRRAAPDLACCVRATAARHAHVHDCDVRPQRRRRRNRRIGVTNRAEQRQAGLSFDQGCKRGSDRGLVLGDQNTYALCLPTAADRSLHYPPPG
jgi:hypothetical protein